MYWGRNSHISSGVFVHRPVHGMHISFALGLLKPNRMRNLRHISHRIIAFEMSAHWLVELIILLLRVILIALLYNMWISLGTIWNIHRVLLSSLLKRTRLLVAHHGFIEIKVILSIPLLQLLIEIRVGILIVRMTWIKHFKIRDAEVALVNLQSLKPILTCIFLRGIWRKMHSILVPLLFKIMIGFIWANWWLETQWRIKIGVIMRRNMGWIRALCLVV